MNFPKLIEGMYEVIYDENTKLERFSATLILFHVDQESVGFYKCLKNSTRHLNWDVFNQLGPITHLFVVSDQNPIVKIKRPLWIWDSCDIIVPCKPTTDVNVSLSLNETKVSRILIQT